MIPLPGWQQWFIEAFQMAMVAVWLTLAAYSFRIRHLRRWIPACRFALGCMASVWGGIGDALLAATYHGYVGRLKNPDPPAQMDENWGVNFSAADRSEHSEMIARRTYRSWGVSVKHFGGDGRMKPFEPTEADRRTFASRGDLIVEVQSTLSILRISTGLWLLLPLASLGLAWVVQARANRGSSTPDGRGA